MTRCSYAILAAAAATLRPTSSSAVTISEYYIDGQVATNADFTTGVQDVDLSGSAPTVNIPTGDYFQFGVALVVTNNPNPAAGDAWDLANQAKGNPAQPQNLGLASVEYNVPSSDTQGYSLAPILGPLEPFSGSTIYQSTAVINPDLNFYLESPGDVRQNGITGILVSNATSINFSTQPSQLGDYSGTSATPDQATVLFTNLAFQSHAAGQVELSPGIVDDPISGYGANYWTNKTPGSVGAGGKLTSATYSYQNQITTADTVSPLPSLTINVTPVQPIVTLSSSAPPTTYGDEVPLYIFRGVASDVIIPSRNRFYIDITQAILNTGNIVDLKLSGASQLLATAINNEDDGVVASSTYPGYPYYPVNSTDLYLTLPAEDLSEDGGNLYLGIDLTQISNIPNIANLSFSNVVILPEPGSMGLLAAGAIALIGRWTRK